MFENKGKHKEINQGLKPQINLARSTSGRMWLVNLCAFMVVIQSSFTDSYSSFILALSAVSAAVLTEFLILLKSGREKSLMDGSAIASALILVLFLPNRISPIYAALGAFFSIAVIKHSFGGLGANWLNPAAGGWLFIRFSWPASFTEALAGSPLSAIGDSVYGIEAFFVSSSPFGDTLRSLLNKTIFSLLGVELPVGYMDLFASRFPGIIADRGVFTLLLGTIIITASQVNRAWISAAYLAVFGILVRFAGALPFGSGYWNGDVIFALLSGGTLAAAFFLAADPATTAKSSIGIFIATLAAGCIAFILRWFGNDPYGVVLTAVFINAMLPMFRVLESRQLYKRQRPQT
jgi:Na+-translocating ferredoxin:NAD+ oxidoreductase subunit D